MCKYCRKETRLTEGKENNIKPILFNTSMVQAILEGRKTSTRRIAKGLKDAIKETKGDFKWDYNNSFMNDICLLSEAPYKIGDVLYVRETWKVEHTYGDEFTDIRFKADNEIVHLKELKEETYEKIVKFESKSGWQPSLFMPKEAARIFLRVKDVRVERLQDITDEGALDEGITKHLRCKLGYTSKNSEEEFNFTQARDTFKLLWNTTVNKKDLDKYGWNANPYVWVIEFKRISREEALNNNYNKE